MGNKIKIIGHNLFENLNKNGTSTYFGRIRRYNKNEVIAYRTKHYSDVKSAKQELNTLLKNHPYSIAISGSQKHKEKFDKINKLIDDVRYANLPLVKLSEIKEWTRTPTKKNPEKLTLVNRKFIEKLKSNNILLRLQNSITKNKKSGAKKYTIKDINKVLNKKRKELLWIKERSVIK